MPYENLQSLKVSVADRVATVVIDNPPINLVDPRFVGDLLNLTAEVRNDEAVGAVVFESADPDFFLAHYDMASRAAPSSSLADAERARAVSLCRFERASSGNDRQDQGPCKGSRSGISVGLRPTICGPRRGDTRPA